MARTPTIHRILLKISGESLARRIAALPLPVWTGIGHETDSGVLDAVAGQAFKTPTALAIAGGAQHGVANDFRREPNPRCAGEQPIVGQLRMIAA